MNNMNDDDNNKFLKMFAIFFMISYFFYFGIMRVSAASIDLSDYPFEYIDENDESLGVIYYEKDEVVEENIMTTFSLRNTQSVEITEDEVDDYIEQVRKSNFTNYPYWVMYLDTVYVSDYPFVIDENDFLYAYDSKNDLNILFESYSLGVSSGLNSVFSLKIDYPLHADKIRSNHDIKYLNSNIADLKAIETYDVPDYNKVEYPYIMQYGYYTIISKHPLILDYDPVTLTIRGLYSSVREVNRLSVNSLKYSYLGTEFSSAIHFLGTGRVNQAGTSRYGFAFKDPYPTNNNFLSFIGKFNYTLNFGYASQKSDSIFYDEFFDYRNPPEGWKSFDPEYVYPPDHDWDSGGNEGDNGEGSILDILSYLNPFSDRFFMLVAFVPRDGYFTDKVHELSEINNNKMQPILSIFSTLGVLFDNKFGDSGWDGVYYGDKELSLGRSIVYVGGLGSQPPSSCKNPVNLNSPTLLGEYYSCSLYNVNLSGLKLVDASYITNFIARFKYWAGAVMNFFFSIWLIRWLLSIFGYHMPHGGYSPGSNDGDKYADFLKRSGYIK